MEGPVKVLREDLVLVDWGPMTLTVSAWEGGKARPVMAAGAAREALVSLAHLAEFKKYLKRRAAELPPGRSLPQVVARARRAAGMAPEELTPLAAVAGAVADQVADAALALGADRVIVNNGGDIAVRLIGGANCRVGIRPPSPPGEDPAPLVGRLCFDGRRGVGGVASSGRSGRSFSPGVADLVTVWAGEAAAADAAATLVAGSVSVDSPAVRRAPARELDPESDLLDMPVTVEVGELSPEEIGRAIGAGMARARGLQARGLIMGCVITLGGGVAVLDEGGLLALEGRGADQ